MENSVIIKKSELEFLMFMMGIEKIEGIASVSENYEVDNEIAMAAMEKGFIEDKDGEVAINKFVEFVLDVAADAKAVFITDEKDACCNFYFWQDIIIYVEKEADSEFYIFRWIPVITTAIGGLSIHFTAIPEDGIVGDEQLINNKTEITFEEFKMMVSEYSKDNICKETKEDSITYFNGSFEGEITYMAAVYKHEEKHIFFEKKADGVTCGNINHLEFIKSISACLIQNHGKCIEPMLNEEGGTSDVNA